jgi:hypothetical protein
MLSYNWETKDLVLKIKTDLESHGYTCWYDSDQMHGSLSDRMSEAVVSSEIFIMCVTDKYRSSYNCTFEAKYAFKKKKPIIPLMIQKLNLDYWLDFIISDRLYVEFFQYTYDECLSQLLDLIKKTKSKKGTHDDHQQHPDAIPEDVVSQQPIETKEAKQDVQANETLHVKPPAKNVENTAQKQPKDRSAQNSPADWSSESVKRWLNSIDFDELANACSGMDGALLKQLYDLLIYTPEYFYQVIFQEDFKKLAKIAKFSKSLKDLFEK